MAQRSGRGGLDLLDGRLVSELTLDGNVTSIDDEMLAPIGRHILRNDDDRCIQVHLYVNCLVGLKCIFKASSSLPAKAFQGLARNILQN